METSFCELRGKEVINVVDGKRLGKIIDLVFDTRFGKILGIVVPSYNKSWNIFKSSDDIFIPYNCICKFGDDTILVQIFIPNQSTNKKTKVLTQSTKQDKNQTQNYSQERQIAVPTPLETNEYQYKEYYNENNNLNDNIKQ